MKVARYVHPCECNEFCFVASCFFMFYHEKYTWILNTTRYDSEWNRKRSTTLTIESHIGLKFSAHATERHKLFLSWLWHMKKLCLVTSIPQTSLLSYHGDESCPTQWKENVKQRLMIHSFRGKQKQSYSVILQVTSGCPDHVYFPNPIQFFVPKPKQGQREKVQI